MNYNSLLSSLLFNPMDNINFWDIDETDIYDADLSSNGKNNERIVVLTEMENTVWFRTIGPYPVNLPEMEYFIKQLDVLDSFKEFDINKVLTFGPGKLDALFLIAKLINLKTVNFCEFMIQNCFIPLFEKLVYDNMEQLSYFSVNQQFGGISNGIPSFYGRILYGYG